LVYNWVFQALIFSALISEESYEAFGWKTGWSEASLE
jgi:hypothetical protein